MARLLVAAVAAFLMVPGAALAANCTAGYHIVGGSTPGNAVTAYIEATQEPVVQSGHVAGIIAVTGNKGTMMVGLSSHLLFYEVNLVDFHPLYEVTGRHKITVAPDPSNGLWRPRVDGNPVGPGIDVGASPDVVVQGESYQETSGPCNSYQYDLTSVRVNGRIATQWGMGPNGYYTAVWLAPDWLRTGG